MTGVAVSATSLVLVASTAAADEHDTGAGHPERAARLAAVARGIAEARLGDALLPFEGRPATVDELARVHGRGYLRALADLAAGGGGNLDPDTPTSAGSWETARLAAGAGLAAIDRLAEGGAAAAFVALRPPGHHATATRGMGFCLLNNVAVAAAELTSRGERVLILDWDVHHGNGTQDIFWDDSDVLYASTHQSPAYPGTGRLTETGGAGAPGLTVNVPLPPGATGDVALAAVDEIIAPAVDHFRPTWVLVSAGFDAHRHDPLANLAWSAGDFADLTRRATAFASSPGHLIAFLEGGYDLAALATSVGATVAALAGASYRPEPPTSGGPGRQTVSAGARARALLLEEAP